MPPKSKRQMQLEQARAAKQPRVTETEPSVPEVSLSDSPQPSTSGASFSEPLDPEIHTGAPEDEGIYDEHSIYYGELCVRMGRITKQR